MLYVLFKTERDWSTETVDDNFDMQPSKLRFSLLERNKDIYTFFVSDTKLMISTYENRNCTSENIAEISLMKVMPISGKSGRYCNNVILSMALSVKYVIATGCSCIIHGTKCRYHWRACNGSSVSDVFANSKLMREIKDDECLFHIRHAASMF